MPLHGPRKTAIANITEEEKKRGSEEWKERGVKSQMERNRDRRPEKEGDEAAGVYNKTNHPPWFATLQSATRTLYR
ncbi:hypothetical protein Q5P01_021119 [Channa striata]|uniref:Uncharacterized protein n=1 Tax=Channa striata TaxID=64152 RepID=A0AA88S8Y3_CHASR|nr:hypothetical protein Q5P01_021119 [Channa striata]